MPGHYLSAALLGLLRQASLTPEQVDAAIDVLARRWTHAMLRAGSPLLQALRQATGINVVTIARRHHRLLLEVDTRHEGQRQWHYHELGRHRTVLTCRTTLPHTLAAATVGRALSDVISGVPIAQDAIITEATNSFGCLTLNLDTTWISY